MSFCTCLGCGPNCNKYGQWSAKEFDRLKNRIVALEDRTNQDIQLLKLSSVLISEAHRDDVWYERALAVLETIQFRVGEKKK